MAWWYWCAEQAYWKAIGIRNKRIACKEKQVGTSIHDLIHKLAGQFRWKWEEEFLHKLDVYRKEGYGFVRQIGNDQIYEDLTGHPDEFQISVSKRVSVIELKTTAIKNMKFWNRYRLPMAQFQTQIYCYILEPILKEMGYSLDKIHAVSVWRVKYRTRNRKRELVDWGHVQDIPVFYYPSQIEEEISMVLRAFKNRFHIIPPRRVGKCFKCKGCPKIYKERCQFLK